MRPFEREKEEAAVGAKMSQGKSDVTKIPRR